MTAAATGGRAVWAWAELVLACDLVASNGWRELPADDHRVVELSALLQSLPVHPDHVRGPAFRSANSVRRKMVDLATHHPDFRGRRTNGGRLDLEVIDGFIRNAAEMSAAAALIRSGARTGLFDDLAKADDLDADEGALEGRLLERWHLTRERDPKMRRKKIEAVLDQFGQLACEVCTFDFESAYGDRGSGYAECHHTVPLHASGETTTRVSDLVVLCANCHRMIHRVRPWLTVKQLQNIVRAQRAADRTSSD